MFKNPFSFKGRIRRTEYGLTLIIYSILQTIFKGLIESSQEFDSLGIAYIPLLWFLWAQGAKRCHDLGNSGWWQIIPFYVFWMLFQDGQRYTNRYGVDPKGLGYSSTEREMSESIETVTSPLPTIEENHTIGKTLLEIKNVSYGNTQDILKKLRNIKSVNQLSLEYIDTTGKVTVQHSGSSQMLLEELQFLLSVEVLKLSNGHIIIKI